MRFSSSIHTLRGEDPIAGQFSYGGSLELETDPFAVMIRIQGMKTDPVRILLGRHAFNVSNPPHRGTEEYARWVDDLCASAYDWVLLLAPMHGFATDLLDASEVRHYAYIPDDVQFGPSPYGQRAVTLAAVPQVAPPAVGARFGR